MAKSKYIRIACKFYNYGLYPENTNIDEIIETYASDKDYYTSIYKYNQSHYDKFYDALDAAASYTSVSVNKKNVLNKIGLIRRKLTKLVESGDQDASLLKSNISIGGTKDVSTNKLVFDFDSSDLEKSRVDTVELCARLIAKGVTTDELQISFSGNKGFSVEVYTTEEFNRKQFENVVFGLASDLETFDTSVKDEQRLFRVPLTKHNSSGLYKVPITLERLTTAPVDVIRGSAKELKSEHYDVANSWKQCILPTNISNMRLEDLSPTSKTDGKKNAVTSPVLNDKPDFSQKPKWLSKTKYALNEGFFPPGRRNEAFMILCSTYQNNGFNKIMAYHMLKGVAELQSKRYSQDKYSTDELWKNVVEVVYGPNWNGGMYTLEESGLLQDVKATFNIVDDNRDIKLTSIGNVADRFGDFAKNIDKNTIKFGIEALDDNALITTGMMVGVLGSPGCHPPGTKVYMMDGSLKKVEDVELGDKLKGPDNKERLVKALFHGTDKMYKIKPLASPEFIVNQHHKLALYNPLSKERKIITVMDFVKIRDKNELDPELRGFSLQRVNFDDSCVDFSGVITGSSFSYKDIGDGEYYGFNLSSDHLYVTEDRIIHNNSGKTSIVTGFIENLSRNNTNVLFESLDMYDNLLYTRMIQKHTGYDTQKILDMFKTGTQDATLKKAMKTVEETYKNVKFNFSSGPTVEEIENDIISYKQDVGNNLKLVVVDYLEKVNGPYSDATANSGFVAGRLADIAKDHDVCVLLLLQPQKSAGDPSEELLSMRKVKGASRIEQDARIIMTLWRPGFNPKDNSNDRFASIAIVKNNMGSPCQVDFKWSGVKGQISSLSPMDKGELSELVKSNKEKKEQQNGFKL